MRMMHCSNLASPLVCYRGEFPSSSSVSEPANSHYCHCTSGKKMAMDSKALFRKKISQCGLNDFQDKFESLGWTNMAEFVLSANYQPGYPDESPFINDVIIALLGDESHPKKAA